MSTFSEVRQISVRELRVSEQQVRTREVDKNLGELVDNIRVHGQLEPIIVAGDGDGYEIIAGQRRWLAMKELGMETILCAVLKHEIDETTARALSISENLVRHDVDSKDLIDACTKLYRKYGSVKAVSQELGLPYGRVRNYVKFDRLRPELKKSVEAGEVDVKTALRIEDHLAGDDCGPDEVQAIVKDVADMTNAQQTHYFTSARKQGVKRAAPSAEASDDHAARPGDVHQVLVTLAREDHLRLREWALRQRLTQDKAAARIINAFLHDLARVGVKGRAEAHSATANDRSLTR